MKQRIRLWEIYQTSDRLFSHSKSTEGVTIDPSSAKPLQICLGFTIVEQACVVNMDWDGVII